MRRTEVEPLMMKRAVVRRSRLVLPISLIVTVLLVGPASAQMTGSAETTDTVLNLSDAKTLLGRRSPEYQAALAAANAAGEGVWTAWGRWLPSADLRISLARNEFTTRTFVDPTGVAQRLEDPITDVAKSSYQGLTFSWSLFDRGTRFFDVGASKATARAADLRAVSTLVRLGSEVEVEYWEALKQQELARLARRQLEARRRDVEIAEARFRIAAVAQTDVLQAEVTVGQNEVAVLQADQQAEASRRELSATLGLDEAMRYTLRDTAVVFDPSDIPLDSLVALAHAASPELARLDAEIEAAGKRLWSARGTWLPRIDLSYTFSRSQQLPGDANLIELSPENSGNNFGITLSWPLLAGFEKKTRTGEESARLQEARHNKVAQLLSTDKDVRNYYESLVTAYQAVQIRTRLVSLARESVRLATERYRIGATTYTELQQATSQLTEAERGLIDARYNFMQTLARLEGAIGRPIPRPR
ncbi:MAG: TolC family protein [Gemmatimonadales bacterium]